MIQSVAILGAGAVGCYMLWGLSNQKEAEVCVIASGERKQRLMQDGLTINGQLYHPMVKTPEEAHGVDLLIVAVKYQALETALPEIAAIADDHTTVMSLMNGVDSEERIGRVIGQEKVIPALIKVASERVGNQIRFDAESTIGVIYGETDPTCESERLKDIARLFEGTGLHYRETDRILNEIWSKFLLNITANQPQAMIGVGVGAYRDSEHLAFFQKRLGDEVRQVAAAKGIDLGQSDPTSSKGSPVADRARYSTLQDLDAGRHTEVDMFAGAVVQMGRELGIPTPCNEFVYHVIKALEEKNDGLFNYE